MLPAEYQIVSVTNTDDERQVITFNLCEVVRDTKEEEDTSGRLQRRPEDSNDWVRQVPCYRQIGSVKEVILKRDNQLGPDEVIELVKATIADQYPEYELVGDEELL